MLDNARSLILIRLSSAVGKQMLKCAVDQMLNNSDILAWFLTGKVFCGFTEFSDRFKYIWFKIQQKNRSL